MKKISLRAIMFIQAAISFCIPLYYHLMFAFHLNSTVPFFISVVLLLIIKRLKDTAVMDEYAKKTLEIADSICFKGSLIIMGVLVLPFLFSDEISPLVTGYLLTIGIFVLVLLRACIFYWIDKRGMD